MRYQERVGRDEEKRVPQPPTVLELVGATWRFGEPSIAVDAIAEATAESTASCHIPGGAHRAMS